MTDATPALPMWGVPEADLQVLVTRGRLRGVLTMDEVVDVLRTVELTAEVIESVRARLAAHGIELDESLPPLDLEDLEGPPAFTGGSTTSTGVPESVEAELQEADDAAAHAAGDFEQDGPELGGVRPARSPSAT